MTQDPTRGSGATGDQPGYAEAVTELDRILEELERDDVDVDVLGARVARAAELIAVCRERIDAARFQVDQIVTSLPTASVAAIHQEDPSPGPAGSAGEVPAREAIEDLSSAYAEPDVDGAGA